MITRHPKLLSEILPGNQGNTWKRTHIPDRELDQICGWCITASILASSPCSQYTAHVSLQSGRSVTQCTSNVAVRTYCSAQCPHHHLWTGPVHHWRRQVLRSSCDSSISWSFRKILNLVFSWNAGFLHLKEKVVSSLAHPVNQFFMILVLPRHHLLAITVRKTSSEMFAEFITIPPS